jgi:hypothetical protein
VLAAVLLGFDAGAAAGGGTGTDLGLAARALRLRGFRTESRSAFAAISARACASSAAHMLSLIIRQSSNLPSALMTSFTNIAHLHAVFTHGGA